MQQLLWFLNPATHTHRACIIHCTWDGLNLGSAFTQLRRQLSLSLPRSLQLSMFRFYLHARLLRTWTLLVNSAWCTSEEEYNRPIGLQLRFNELILLTTSLSSKNIQKLRSTVDYTEAGSALSGCIFVRLSYFLTSIYKWKCSFPTIKCEWIACSSSHNPDKRTLCPATSYYQRAHTSTCWLSNNKLGNNFKKRKIYCNNVIM